MSETESIEKCDFLDKTITILASKISLNKIHIWASENIVVLDFSRPGKPTDNAFIESFNGSFRDEFLNVNWFLSLEDARIKSLLSKRTITISERTVRSEI